MAEKRQFQSTLCVCRATPPDPPALPKQRFQSTLCVCRATLISAMSSSDSPNFNPRSAYAERLFPNDGSLPPTKNFNPRSAYAERPRSSTLHPVPGDFNPRSAYAERHCIPNQKYSTQRFQSTLCVCRATQISCEPFITN